MQQFRATRVAGASSFLSRFGGVPAIVVNASDDVIAPLGAGLALARSIPGARFLPIFNASHGVTLLDAPIINDMLLEHLDAAERVR
ncbi:MAG: alpha/beta fold hydrolase [Longimicrobiales bacterium]